jgi:hypothetical protein
MFKPVTLLLLISVATSVVAEEDSTESFTQPVNDGRHLVQLGYTSIEGFDGDLTVVAANYTYSYSRHLRFSGTTQLAHLEAPETGASSDAGEKDDTGLGDSVLILQYDPDANLTSSPWVPDTLGVFGGILLPTGDTGKGLGGDAWAGAIGIGWPILVRSTFVIIPSADYTKSFIHGNDALRLDELAVRVSLLWVSPTGIWLGIEPQISRDFENHATTDAFSVIVGKSFRNGLGVELRWGKKRRFENLADDEDDENLLLTLSWQFGAPPG